MYSDLLKIAQQACMDAGQFVRAAWRQDFAIASKDGASPTSSVVTEIDLKSQQLILDRLRASIERYDLGLLAEESADDGSRLRKEHFWTVDPLDGTLAFSQGQPGFAVTAALIDRAGRPQIGVVYEPISGDLYTAMLGGGAHKNGRAISALAPQPGRIQVYADRSLKFASNYAELEQQFDIHLGRGGVMNAIAVLEDPCGAYFKFPYDGKGGSAIWDLAATSLILNEAGCTMSDFQGRPLNFNQEHSVYLSRDGLMACNNDAVRSRLSGCDIG